MNKSLLFLLAFFTAFAACRRDDDTGTNGNGSDPVDRLTIEPQTYATLINYSEIGESNRPFFLEYMYRYVRDMDITPYVLGINIPAEGDVLFDTAYNDFSALLSTQIGLEFYLNSEIIEFTTTPEQIEHFSAPLPEPYAGVNHEYLRREGDSAYVRVKVEFFKNSYNEKHFYVSSFLTGDFRAQMYGSDNLMLAGATDLISNAGGQSTFVINYPNDSTTLFTAGEVFVHKRVVLAKPGVGITGIPLDSVNLFGNEFEIGDVLGTRNTPIEFSIPWNPRLDQSQRKGIWTVLYEAIEGDDLDDNGDPILEFHIINSYHSYF